MATFIDRIKERARADKKTIILPESMDSRIYEAAEKVLKEDIANIIIIGTPEEVEKYGKGYDVSKATIINPYTYEKTEEYLNLFVELRKSKGLTYEEAKKMQEVQHETGKILNIGVVNRFNDSVNLIKKYIDDGKLGEVYHVYASFRAHRSIPGLGGAFTTKEIAGGGALIDWGVHYLDIVMYCCGDPVAKTVSGEVFSKLGVDMKGYAYKDMWAGPPKFDGIYDVDDSVVAMIRTDGPTITVHGAWAQNIGENEQYIDFIGDKAGIRLQYGKDFTIYTAEHGALVEYKPQFKMRDHFQNEIDAFINCCKTGEKLPSHIDTNILTSRMMQAIYDSAEQHREIVLE